MKAVQPKLLLAVLAATLVAGPATAADSPPAAASAAPLKVVEEAQTGDTKVIVLERTPRPVRETPEWAYPDRGLTFFPDGPGKDKDRWAIGGLWQIAPFFTATYTRGLGSGFALQANLQTIVLFNQVNVGAQWGFDIGPFAFALTGQGAVYFGALGKAFVETTSFNSTGWGILVLPGAKAGLQVARDSWLTLQYQAYLSAYQATTVGTLTLSPKASSYAGFGLSAIVEYTPDKKRGAIYYGVTLYNTAANYPIFFNVEATPSSEAFNNTLIWYVGALAGYEF